MASNADSEAHSLAPIQTVALIGSGAVATHLGLALREAGYAVSAVCSPTHAHAKALAERLGTETRAVSRLEELPRADAYIFSVKDDALPGLAQAFGRLHPEGDALLIHTAGSVPLSIWQGTTRNGAVLYPLQTFSRGRAVSFAHLPLFIEGASAAARVAVSQLAHHLSDQVKELNSERRRYVHLAAVFACNFTNHCYALAAELLQEHEIDPRCLWPLTDETARKVHELSPVEAQTGPAARWDVSVMQAHERLLADCPRELLDVYRLMSRSIHEMAQRHNGDAPAR